MSSQSVARELISNLPDEILGKILSSLPTHVAASTSVLSKRWRNLLAFVDTLDLSDASGGDPLGFPEFVEKQLALLTNASMIKRFHLNLKHGHEETRVNGWIRTALERGILELHLNSKRRYRIETEFFRSNTLVELTISGEFYLGGCRPREGLFFPALKRLTLVPTCFEDCIMYENLVSCCPVLEELVLLYVDEILCPAWNVHVFSSSIKRLTIHHSGAHKIVAFATPSLLYLDYSGHVSDKYEVDLDSLVEARLNLRPLKLLCDEDHVSSDSDSLDDYTCSDSEDEDDAEDDDSGGVTDLVAKISNVEILHLSSDSLEAFHYLCKSMPVFHNLRKLSFESDEGNGWQVVPLLLNNSPKLETLVIKGLVHKFTKRCGDACICIPKMKNNNMGVCCLSTCQVKVLIISGYRGTPREWLQMRHFLANLKCLETVKVGVDVDRRKDYNNRYLTITDALINVPRVSSNCQLHLF